MALGGLARNTIVSRALNAREATMLSTSLEEDARDAAYSGALSIAEALQGLDRGFFTWSTVKLYYSVFYLARAVLALQGVGIVYSGHTPYTWAAVSGAVPTKRSGTTHKVVLDAFAHFNSGSVLISQPIGGDTPFEWLVARREAANYTITKFSEPHAPVHFKFIEPLGVRRLVNNYVVDTTHLYTFDPDHAMLAFPIAALRLVLGELKVSRNGSLPTDEMAFLASLVFDRSGPLAELRKLLLA